MELADRDTLGQTASEGAIRTAIARTVPLGEAIQALIELGEKQTPEGGKLVISP